jgi:hypothetical protein
VAIPTELPEESADRWARRSRIAGIKASAAGLHRTPASGPVTRLLGVVCREFAAFTPERTAAQPCCGGALLTCATKRVRVGMDTRWRPKLRLAELLTRALVADILLLR